MSDQLNELHSESHRNIIKLFGESEQLLARSHRINEQLDSCSNKLKLLVEESDPEAFTPNRLLLKE